MHTLCADGHLTKYAVPGTQELVYYSCINPYTHEKELRWLKVIGLEHQFKGWVYSNLQHLADQCLAIIIEQAHSPIWTLLTSRPPSNARTNGQLCVTRWRTRFGDHCLATECHCLACCAGAAASWAVATVQEWRAWRLQMARREWQQRRESRSHGGVVDTIGHLATGHGTARLSLTLVPLSSHG